MSEATTAEKPDNQTDAAKPEADDLKEAKDRVSKCFRTFKQKSKATKDAEIELGRAIEAVFDAAKTAKDVKWLDVVNELTGLGYYTANRLRNHAKLVDVHGLEVGSLPNVADARLYLYTMCQRDSEN